MEPRLTNTQGVSFMHDKISSWCLRVTYFRMYVQCTKTFKAKIELIYGPCSPSGASWLGRWR